MSAASGWADDRLMQAQDLIELVRLEVQNAGLFDVAKAMKVASTAVESADIVLEQERAA